VPTVLTLGRIRVVIYTNDHPPAHVHAVRGDEARARFELNCPDGPVQLIEHDGFTLAEINRIGRAVAETLAAICARWREIHG
jgi:hypothetical protein